MENRFVIVERGAVNGEQGADVPVPWWSFTKTIIAAAILVMVRNGQLALDEPFPGHRFSLRQILRHRAGLTDYGGLSTYHEAVTRGDEPWPVADLLERTQADRLRYEPGRGWLYSNIGYLFLRQLIERRCGERLGTALRAHVFDPLGIDAHVAETSADVEDMPGVMHGYHPGWVYHGLVTGTLRDAALLQHRLMTGDFLTPDLLGEMCDAYPIESPADGRPWKMPGFGLGVMSGTTANGMKAVGHTGGGPGSTIAVYHLPELTPPRTVAAFASGGDQARIEKLAFGKSGQ